MDKKLQTDHSNFNNLHFVTFAEGKQFTKFAEWNKKKLLKAYPGAKVIIYNSFDLSEEIVSFATSNPRGFGYWIWKPWILAEYIKNVKNNEFVVYFDSRAAFFGKSVNWIDRSLKLMPDKRGDFYVYRSSSHLEIEYTKMDTLKFFELETNNDILYTGQIFGTIIGINLNFFTRSVINNWLNFPIYNNLLINDEVILPNFPEYIENRHDQSIFSLLLKKTYNLNNSKILFLPKEDISKENSFILHYFTHPRRKFSSLKNIIKLSIPFKLQMYLRSLKKLIKKDGFYT